MDWTITWKVFGIVYIATFIPAFKTAIAFWLYRNQNEVVNKAMGHGFFLGFISIWSLYPFYMIDRLFRRFKNK